MKAFAVETLCDNLMLTRIIVLELVTYIHRFVILGPEVVPQVLHHLELEIDNHIQDCL